MEQTGEGADGRQGLRQVLRDLLELHLRGGINGDSILLLLSLVNILGVIELLGRRQGSGEGQFFQRLLGPFISSGAGSGSVGGEEATPAGLRVVSGGKNPVGLFGKEGLGMLAALLNNRELLEMVLPLLQRLGSAANPGTKNPAENSKETPVRKSQGREVIRWDFGRNEGDKKKG